MEKPKNIPAHLHWPLGQKFSGGKKKKKKQKQNHQTKKQLRVSCAHSVRSNTDTGKKKSWQS